MEIFYNFVKLALIFAGGCIIGWVIEVFFRRFNPANKERVWINPGFLVGPYLPLYGCGLLILYLLAGLEQYIDIENIALRKGVLFIIMACAMTLIEFIAGEIFIIRMHVKLWDYSTLWGNYKGIICPLFSFFWAVLGAVYYFFVHPIVVDTLDWFSHNLIFSFIIGLFYGVFIVDVVYSLNLVQKIKDFATENQTIIYYEELKRNIRRRAKSQKEKYNFMLALASSNSIKQELKNYLESKKPENIKEIGEKIIDKIKNN